MDVAGKERERVLSGKKGGDGIATGCVVSAKESRRSKMTVGSNFHLVAVATWSISSSPCSEQVETCGWKIGGHRGEVR